MVTRPQTHKFQLTVLAAFLALLALIILSAQSYAGARLESVKVATFTRPNSVMHPRVSFAPLAGKRSPAPLANLEAPLAGRRTPAPLALQDVERESTAGLRFHPAMALPLLFLVRFIIKAIDEKLNKS